MPGPASSGERPAKRSRVSRACDQCRTAREKCDGTQPTCQTCSTSKRSCTYTSAPKKRGIQPGYIRTLELALTWLFQNTDSEALLNKKIAEEGISSVLFGRETKESNRLHKSWRKSGFFKKVDKLLSGEQPGCNQTPKSDEDDDSDAEADVATGPSQSSQPQTNPISPTTQFTSPEFSRPILRPNLRTAQPTEAVLRSQAPTPLPAHSWRLLDIYFAHTQSWFPICEKHHVLRISYSYPEQGVILSELLDSGDHAELWSILALAAQQARIDQQDTENALSCEQLYEIARDLIPSELGSFTAGHVKALLNLAVINLGRYKLEAAWLLVGSASRILKVIGRSSPTSMPRYKQLLAGCFLLDGFLSLQLGRTHLQRPEVQNIEEDGLEEWQPWTDPLQSAPPSRTPVMGLSSFNKLLDLTDILMFLNTHQSTAVQQPSRLDYWKAALPAKFDYIIDERRQTPMNPPALLLQATYLCTYFSEHPSQAPVQRFIELLEQYQAQLGICALPPPIHCQLDHIRNHSTYSAALDERLRSRLERISDEITRAWASPRAHTIVRALAPQGRPSFGAYQVPTPESIQIPFHPPPFPPIPNRPPAPVHSHRHSTSLIDDLLPDMNPTTSTDQSLGNLSTGTNMHSNFDVSPAEDEFPRPALQNRQSAASGMVPPDLENFFDELASLDGAEKLDSQPQFMENLGFAPNANMADFLAAEFGQFRPGNTSAFIPHHDDPTHLDPAFFGAT